MRRLVAASIVAALASLTQLAHAEEPWSDPDPPAPPARTAFGDYGIRPALEYRANGLYINPINPTGTFGRRASWIEHRLRVDVTVDYKDKVKIVTSTDVLDGAVWGDNGNTGTTPAPNSGINVNARNPNVTTACVQYRGNDAISAKSYAYGLCQGEAMHVRRMYGEVALPIGVLRVGRQPVNLGTGVQNADGDGRPNRFGFSRQGNFVDRVLFATKPLEAFKAKSERNLSPNEGLIYAIGYDHYVNDDPHLFRDNVHQFFHAARYQAPSWRGGRGLLIAGNHAYRWDGEFGSKIHNLALRVMNHFGDVFVGFEVVTNQGSTREISTAYGLLTNDPPVDQTIKSYGGRAVVRYDRPIFTAYMEVDYASGDPDPTPRTPLTGFTFAEDTNVGLLLFEHVMHSASARSSAAGVELLRRLGARTFPAEAVNTRGSFTNAFALFPQFDVHPTPSVLLRGGVLMAWAPTPVNDPIGSLQARDGGTIQDDLVNFAGGKPGRYYGTELDGRVQYKVEDHFLLDLEGAVLFPGSALKDKDGLAARSVMVQGRTTFFF